MVETIEKEVTAKSKNKRGNTYDRRARRAWIVRTFALDGVLRCVHCWEAVGVDAFHVDRFPTCGHAGGRYVRGNIVPSCGPCNIARCGRCDVTDPREFQD